LFELFAPEEDAICFPLVLLPEELVAVMVVGLFPIVLTCFEEEPWLIFDRLSLAFAALVVLVELLGYLALLLLDRFLLSSDDIHGAMGWDSPSASLVTILIIQSEYVGNQNWNIFEAKNLHLILGAFVRFVCATRSKNFLSKSASSLREVSICSGVSLSKSCCLLRKTC
jgi:hypothetical protein